MVRFFLDCLTLEAEGIMTLLKVGNYSPKDIVSHPRRYESSILILYDVGKLNTSIIFSTYNTPMRYRPSVMNYSKIPTLCSHILHFPRFYARFVWSPSYAYKKKAIFSQISSSLTSCFPELICHFLSPD